MKVAKTCLAEWPALQLAVANGQAAEVLVEMFKENDDMDVDEDYLTKIMKNEFDMIIEDWNVEFVSKEVIEYQEEDNTQDDVQEDDGQDVVEKPKYYLWSLMAMAIESSPNKEVNGMISKMNNEYAELQLNNLC